MKEKVRILGIDPGYEIVGYCFIDVIANSIELVEAGAIITERSEKFSKRLLKIYNEISHLIEKYKPGEMAIETLYFFKNSKTAIEVGEARGVILLAATMKELDIFEYTPYQVKIAVSGYGKATKNQVQDMVKILLGLKEKPKPDDVADAAAVAICHANSRKTLLWGNEIDNS
ncbi:MAG: crossover junction endodeoxyribonuclease RuvC [Thermotogaceae bacterium]|nr:crossover junction endodeoxyribonuclease RuvC [Thermotogaceae bacterium]MDN5338080.1 crossover junction endodeoxyribonuclease RuvC [Thermotogaceae bacterium]